MLDRGGYDCRLRHKNSLSLSLSPFVKSGMAIEGKDKWGRVSKLPSGWVWLRDRGTSNPSEIVR
jgi:hypothetical protein